ncbi:hypothetical protein BUE93_04950 [Chromobacterium amazonense]|uniref:Uncharacterized protein n=1 Tax=Chromobacterium amazonense TaxID=1382803 RepID=A0A2S9X7V1_9NEIS|nr:hypothetical protein BUE93_04950 [Chromobacterium amazonense]
MLLLNGGVLRGQLLCQGAVAFGQRGAVALGGGQVGCLALQLAVLLPQGVTGQQGSGAGCAKEQTE